MRSVRFDHRLAGGVLAVIAMTGLAAAAPDRAEIAVNLRPTLGVRPAQTHRDAVPLPVAAPANDGVTIKNGMLTAADPVSRKLHDLITSRQFDKHLERATERKALAAFYAARGYTPLWTSSGALTARAKAVIARLKDAGADGLDAADYPVANFNGDAEQLAQADLTLTASVLTFARHLQVGRIAPTRVFAQVDYGNHAPDPADILRKISGASDVNAAFDSFNPQQQGFKELKEKLAAVRASAGANDIHIAAGPVIRPGTRDARVPALRRHFGMSGKASDPVYDRKLFEAVRHLQARAGIKPTGYIDARTLDAINGPPRGQIADRLAANMERWRWLPRDFARNYVMVNIPDYSLKVVHDNQVVWRTKIVAGKPQTPTPLLAAAMDNVLVNPSWHVPQSIIQNELLPRYASDPNIFDRLGLEVKRGSDGNITVVQPPGAANALGRIKFNFPNKFQVYLHDTPEKRLFAADKRAFSHGCMRVENPTKFGEVVLQLGLHGPAPDAQQLSAQFGHEERTYRLAERPAVYLAYQTAFVDDAGKLQLRDDIYGFDARIHAIMQSDERRIADIAPPPDPDRDAATARSNQELLSRVERREADNPFQFFEHIFH